MVYVHILPEIWNMSRVKVRWLFLLVEYDKPLFTVDIYSFYDLAREKWGVTEFYDTFFGGYIDGFLLPLVAGLQSSLS